MEILHILALQRLSGIGPKLLNKILSTESITAPSTPSDLLEIFKVANSVSGKIPVPSIENAVKGWTQAQEILKISKENNIRVISRDSPEYPKFLSRIPDPPALLHVKGNIELLNKDCVAVVGTRTPSELGIIKAEKISFLLSKEGYVVVSGLANGIDSAAHLGALNAGGFTIAVLSHGLDTVYPRENEKLADQILKNNGVLVSEHPWGTKINKSNLVSRDRIQSGLSLGVFVVETKEKGGTMHTVEFCKNQNRTLVVLRPYDEFVPDLKVSGNKKLISDKLADFYFKENEDLNSIKVRMESIKKETFKDNFLSYFNSSFENFFHSDAKNSINVCSNRNSGVESKKKLWSDFCHQYNVLEKSVPLFETEGLLINTYNYGNKSKKRKVLKRSKDMESLIINEAKRVVVDFHKEMKSGYRKVSSSFDNESFGIYDGLLYIMLSKEGDTVIPLYIGKCDKFDKNHNLSENFKNVEKNKGQFCGWGYNKGCHLGDLSSYLFDYDNSPSSTLKYEKWVNVLFKSGFSAKPELKEQIFIWVVAWNKENVGPWKEFGPISLEFLESLLIGIVNDIFPNTLLRD
ncbi:MAG: DNA-processing protein DprA [Methanosarcina vacuolata]|jgi:DNA processing protein|nr:DNA-processing protein DprA [Methanosarcina vacuolata]